MIGYISFINIVFLSLYFTLVPEVLLQRILSMEDNWMSNCERWKRKRLSAVTKHLSQFACKHWGKLCRHLLRFWYFAGRASQYIYFNINQLEDSLNLCTGRPPTGVMIPEAV